MDIINIDNDINSLLTHIRCEHKEWTEHNFPGQLSHQPLLGIIEEIGELLEAINSKYSETESFDNDDIKDAIADIFIFCVGYINVCCKNFSINPKTLESMIIDIQKSEYEVYVIGLIAKMARQHLKMEQRIRCGIDDFVSQNNEEIKSLITEVMLYTVFCYYYFIGNQDMSGYLKNIIDVWDKVKARDWKKFPYNGVDR
mgnify:CR=1 FL=1